MSIISLVQERSYFYIFVLLPMSNPIEEDEQIIKLLEDIDENFSSIKATLRDLKIKISKFSIKNKEIVMNCSPWINFFEAETKVEFSPLSELHLNSLKFKEINNSPNNLNFTTPNNPFIEAESSELLNKSIFKRINYCSTSSSTPILLDKPGLENSDNKCNHDSDETEIKPFQLNLLPPIFQKETDLLDLYNFIQKHRSVSLESIIENFKDISHEKLKILVSLLCRKNFVRQKDSKITIEK